MSYYPISPPLYYIMVVKHSPAVGRYTEDQLSLQVWKGHSYLCEFYKTKLVHFTTGAGLLMLFSLLVFQLAVMIAAGCF